MKNIITKKSLLIMLLAIPFCLESRQRIKDRSTFSAEFNDENSIYLPTFEPVAEAQEVFTAEARAEIDRVIDRIGLPELLQAAILFSEAVEQDD